MENVTLKPKEQTRLQVLNSLLAEHMTLDQAATLIGVSPRHTRRILADYRKNGAASLAHGHRGRKPANAIPETTRSRVVHLARRYIISPPFTSFTSWSPDGFYNTQRPHQALEYRTPAEVYTSEREADMVHSQGTLTLTKGVKTAGPDLSLPSFLSN